MNLVCIQYAKENGLSWCYLQRLSPLPASKSTGYPKACKTSNLCTERQGNKICVRNRVTKPQNGLNPNPNIFVEYLSLYLSTIAVVNENGLHPNPNVFAQYRSNCNRWQITMTRCLITMWARLEKRKWRWWNSLELQELETWSNANEDGQEQKHRGSRTRNK